MKEGLEELACNKMVNTGKQLGISQAKGRLRYQYQVKKFIIESLMTLPSKHLDLQINFRQWLYAKWITIILYIKYKWGQCQL